MALIRRRALHGAATAVVLAAVGACGSPTATADRAPTPKAAPSTTPDQTYVVFPDNVPATGWGINTAARRGDPDSRDLLDEVPEIAWSAEYEDLGQGESDSDPYIKISGFDHALTAKTLMFSDRTIATEGEIAGYPALWGTDPDDPEGSTFVALALGPGHSVELEAYNVTVDALRNYAATLRPATAAEWLSAHRAADVH